MERFDYSEATGKIIPRKIAEALMNVTDETLLYGRIEAAVSAESVIAIIKPANTIPNANNSEQNIVSIIGRFHEAGWRTVGVKGVPGNALTLARLAAHYPRPFSDASIADLRAALPKAEKTRLATLWGPDATAWPLLHPVQLGQNTPLQYPEIARLWHAGRGVNNDLLDVGSPEGINTISPVEDPIYGKRRLLRIKHHPNVNSGRPFFIVNGFTAEIISKFTRDQEKIAVLLLERQNAGHDIAYLRKHIIGTTVPKKAKPGSIRYDALRPHEYRGSYPVTSLETVGIENNIIHMSDSPQEATHEVALWMPEFRHA